MFGGPELEVSSRPLSLEDKGGVEGGNETASNDDHDTLKSDESLFVIGELAGEAS